MSINIKKYTKDQMAKMVEDAQTEVQELKRVNAALTEQIDQMNGEAITRENVIAKQKADADALRVQLKNANDIMEAVSKELQRVNSENDGLQNKLADTEAALGRANGECAFKQETLNVMRNRRYNAEQRANYAETHPWRNLWARFKRKLGGEGNEHVF